VELQLIEVNIDEMVHIQFMSSVNPIQMSWMKVIDLMNNISIQGFQNCEFFRFGDLKTKLKGEEFETLEDLQERAEERLRQITPE
jgi:hypothetical protein